ncbi:MAG: BBP7 family outer membrane beta-barrel protein [Thermoguttaceae bacterium]
MEQVPVFQNRPIIVDANTGATFLSTSDLDSGFDPGVRTMFGMRLCNGLAVEFSYFGLSQDGFTLTEKPDNTSYLIFSNNFAGNVFVNMDRAQVNYSSRVNSFELNFPCCCGCCTKCDCDDCSCGQTTCSMCGRVKAARGGVRCSSLEWFAGIRYLDIDNELNIAVERRENGGVEDGSYNIEAGNHLIGAQLGARLRRTVNRFGWELVGKAGVYANDAEQTQSVIDFPNFPLRPTTSATGCNTAFVGEINVSGIYRLTDVWSAKAGYNAIWIEGLALAPDQLDFNFATSPSGNQLRTSGGLLLHGVNVGLESRW